MVLKCLGSPQGASLLESLPLLLDGETVAKAKSLGCACRTSARIKDGVLTMSRANPKPLRINVMDHDVYYSTPLTKIAQKGHAVEFRSTDSDFDVIIGPTCWRIDPALGHLDKQLTMMIEGVRNIKYPKPQKGGKE